MLYRTLQKTAEAHRPPLLDVNLPERQFRLSLRSVPPFRLFFRSVCPFRLFRPFRPSVLAFPLVRPAVRHF